MPTTNEGPLTLTTAEAITALQLLKIDSNGKWAVCTAQSDKAVAIAPTDCASGGKLAGQLIMAGGKLKGIASAAIAAGADIAPTTAGKFVTRSSSSGSMTAVTAAAGDGSVFEFIARGSG